MSRTETFVLILAYFGSATLLAWGVLPVLCVVPLAAGFWHAGRMVVRDLRAIAKDMADLDAEID